MKIEHLQREENKSIKNTDAEFKALAYKTMNERRYEAEYNDPTSKMRDKLHLYFDANSFEHFYTE